MQKTLILRRKSRISLPYRIFFEAIAATRIRNVGLL